MSFPVVFFVDRECRSSGTTVALKRDSFDFKISVKHLVFTVAALYYLLFFSELSWLISLEIFNTVCSDLLSDSKKLIDSFFHLVIQFFLALLSSNFSGKMSTLATLITVYIWCSAFLWP